jgi:hypothetical protein
VLAEIMFDVYEAVYNFIKNKNNRTIIRALFFPFFGLMDFFYRKRKVRSEFLHVSYKTLHYWSVSLKKEI